MWEQVGDPEPTLPPLFKCPIVFAQQAYLAEEHVWSLLADERSAVVAMQQGFVVEGVDLTEAAAENDLNHAAHTWREMGPADLGFGGFLLF